MLTENLNWVLYKKLENDIIELSYYVQFTDKPPEQLLVFSNKIADLLISVCVQIESLYLQLYHKNFSEKCESIGRKINKLDEKFELQNKQVKIISDTVSFYNDFAEFFQPLCYKAKDENDYYSNYNAVKHDRYNCLNKANMNVLIRALASLYILNIFYGSDVYFISDLREFDFTFQSNFFICGCITDNDILTIKENKSFDKELELYVNAMPREISKHIEYETQNPPPHLYEVRLNYKQEEQTNGQA